VDLNISSFHVFLAVFSSTKDFSCILHVYLDYAFCLYNELCLLVKKKKKQRPRSLL
jgi:hypothetical protein